MLMVTASQPTATSLRLTAATTPKNNAFRPQDAVGYFNQTPDDTLMANWWHMT